MFAMPGKISSSPRLTRAFGASVTGADSASINPASEKALNVPLTGSAALVFATQISVLHPVRDDGVRIVQRRARVTGRGQSQEHERDNDGKASQHGLLRSTSLGSMPSNHPCNPRKSASSSGRRP